MGINGPKGPSRAAYILPPMLSRIFRLSAVGEYVGSPSHTHQQGAARGRAVTGHNRARVRAGIGMTHQQPSTVGAQDSHA